MIRTRSARTLATLGVTVSLALTAIAGPVMGAQASATFSATAVLQDVTPSGFVAYDVSFDLAEGETSNLSQLFLTATTPNGWDLVGIESGSGFTASECDDTGTDLTCSFGGMAPADPAIIMRVVYQVGTNTGPATVHFLFNTTGVSADKKKNSHGDSYDAFDEINVENNADLGGSYVQNTGDIVQNDQDVSRRNPQSIKVTSPAADIPITVNEDTNISDCTALFGNACFGNANVLNVNNGTSYAPGGFKVEIVYNVVKPGASFIHFFDNGGSENLVTCGATPVAPCAKVVTANGKTFATLYLNTNGKTFGH
jgi:hypothetical protein